MYDRDDCVQETCAVEEPSRLDEIIDRLTGLDKHSEMLQGRVINTKAKLIGSEPSMPATAGEAKTTSPSGKLGQIDRLISSIGRKMDMISEVHYEIDSLV